MRPEVSVDESSINKHQSTDFVWYGSEEGPWIHQPTGKGERRLMMHAISKDGGVAEANVVLKSPRKPGDYHGQMHGDVLQTWLREKLRPTMPRASLSIMDHASSHKRLAEYAAPTPTCSQAKRRQWLDATTMPCKADGLTVELAALVRTMPPEPTYTRDVIARQYGHDVSRTPPSHPELQPIETCWGSLQNEVARHGDLTLDNLKRPLEQAFDKITATTCQGIIDTVRSVEDRFWEEDARLDAQQENLRLEHGNFENLSIHLRNTIATLCSWFLPKDPGLQEVQA